VDIPEVDASKVPARYERGNREVESLRLTTLGRADGRSLTRIEIRLAEPQFPYQIYSKDKLLNLVFERRRPRRSGPGNPGPDTAATAPAAPPDATLQAAADGPAQEMPAPDESAPTKAA
jgi:hypothetical protein